MTQQSMFSDNPDGLDPPGPRSLDYLIQDPLRWIIDFQGALSVATLTDGGSADEDKGNPLLMKSPLSERCITEIPGYELVRLSLLSHRLTIVKSRNSWIAFDTFRFLFGRGILLTHLFCLPFIISASGRSISHNFFSR